MKKRFLFLSLIIVIISTIIVGIGYASWQMSGRNNGKVEEDFDGYSIIDLDNISSSTPAFYYNSAGFYGGEYYSYDTTFTIEINATQKEEPYDLHITLIDQDDFLSSTTITSESSRNNETGDKNIDIEGIDENIIFTITFTISSTEENYSSIFTNLSENNKDVSLRISATTPEGLWSLDTKILLQANVQSLISVDLPTPHLSSFVYNGQEQYCVDNNNAYNLTNNTRTNAGSQNVTVQLKPGYQWSDGTTGVKNVVFTIKKLEIYIDYTQLIPSNSRVYSWSNFKSLILPQFKKNSDDSVIDIPTSDYTISGINDGEYYYGAKVNGLKTYSTSVMGSTYKASVSFSNSNYDLVYSDFYIKYQTVLIGSNHYTIEDALSQSSGNIITDANTLASATDGDNGIVLSTTSALITKFTELDYYKSKTDGKRAYELKSSTGGLYVSYDGTSTYKTKESASDVTGSVLYITANTVLNAYQNIYVAGCYVANKHTVNKRGVLFNNGQINLNSDMESYGFVKGAGNIDVASNKNITELICFYSFTSGGPTLSMSNAKIFPLTTYSFHNISCTVKIPYNSNYKVYYDIDITATISGYLTLLGNGGLFELTSGYLIKGVEDTTGTSYSINNKGDVAKYNISNQDKTQREVIEIYGQFSDNVVSIKSGSTGITTGTGYAMPIGFMNISLKDDGLGNVGIGNLTANSYKFLPGSRLEICPGTSLTIGNNLNVIFYDETYSDDTTYSSNSTIAYNKQHSAWYSSGRDDIGSQLIVNGSLTANGHLGGIVNTTSNTGQLTIHYNSASLLLMTGLTYSGSTLEMASLLIGGTTTTTVTSTVYCAAYMLKNSFISNSLTEISAATYYSYQDSVGNCGWYASSGTLSYNTNGGTPQSYESRTIQIGQNGYTITSSDIGYQPTRENYTFGGWYIDSSFTTSAIDQVIYSGVTLYAKWNPIVYSITYHLDGGINDVNNLTSYNVETNFIFLNPSKEGYVFLGWYKTSSWSNQVTSIVPGDFGDLVLYARWISEEEDLFTINYISYTYNEDPNFPDYSEQKTSISEFVLRDYTNKNSDESYSKYFDGWFLEPEHINIVNSISDTLFSNSDSITLYSKWENKVVVKLKYTLDNGNVMDMELYIAANKSFSIPPIPASLSSFVSVPDGHELVYDISGGLMNGQTVMTGDQCMLSSTWGDSITVTARFEPYKYNVTITAGSNGNVSQTSITNVPYGTEVKKDSNKLTINGTTVTATANNNYTFDSWTNCPTTITGDVTITATFKSSGGGSCLLPNTLVAMADGTFKEIQYIVQGEMVIVFNHETGMLDVAPVTFNEYEAEQWFNVIHLIFDNGSNIGVISEHGFFDLDTMRYEYIDESNYMNFMGHRFYTMDGTYTILVDAYVENEFTMCYSLPSYYHLNLFTDDILSMPGGITGLFNIFEYAANLQYDQEKMIEDINTYGLFTIEEFEPYGVTEEMFYAYAGQYLKVALGKGILTEEYLYYLIERYGGYTE